jgi:hypothetical protein
MQQTMKHLGRRLIRNLRRKLYGVTGCVPQPNKWLFLVGCYNSGTTLLHRLLSYHPQIGSMVTEGQFYTDQLPVPQELGLARSWALQPERFRMKEIGHDEIDVNRIKRQWQCAFNDSERPVLMEKSPPNAARIRWLNANFENSCFVAIVRNPYAAIQGISRKGGLSIEQAALQWESSNRIMLADLRDVPRSRVVSYEELTADPTGVLEQITGFLSLDPLNAELTSGRFKIHERNETIHNLNAAAIRMVSTDDLRRINRVTHALQTELDYPTLERADAST